MLVFRLEDKEGWGPFTYNTKWPQGLDEEKPLHNSYLCTVPEARTVWSQRHKYRFGCRTLKHLSKYWGDELDKWTKEGWVIAVYKVRKNYVLNSKEDIEVAFMIDKAIKL